MKRRARAEASEFWYNRSMKKRITIIASVAAVAALCIALLFVGRKEGGEAPKETPPPARGEAKRPAKVASRTVRRPSRGDVAKRSAKPVLSVAEVDDDDDGFTPAERALSKRIEDALDEEDLSKAVACAKEALNCPNAEVRQSMVDTLGWFGAKGLPELTPFLADADEDVRDSAMNEWSMALSDIDDEGEKLGVVEMAMAVLTNEDALEDISGEYIGADEKLAVESLLRIIEGGGSAQGIEKAKETYEFVTGDEFVDRAAAEKWIAEEYQPSDPPPTLDSAK